jgi:DNA polymerase-3 subunit gamma/tau
LVLARKYRSQTFADLVGQEHVSRTLTNAIQLGRVAHAFLFTGVRGVGKTSAARILAKALNCKTGPTPTPCNECTACLEITQGISADVLEIDGASNRGIDSIRELRESVRYMPRQGSFRIFIIDEVHMLTQESFNALLKTLEEPPAHVKFIFATTESHKIPITILSRCQRYDFHRIPTPEIARHIQELLSKEEITMAPAGVARVARAAEGSMRDALSLLDQVISFAGTKVSAEQVSEALGSADRTALFGVARALLARDPASALSLVDQVFRKGYDLGQFAEDLLTLLRDLVAVKAGSSAEELGEEDLAEVKRLVAERSLPELIRAFQTLSKTCEELARSTTPKALFEVSLVKLATLPPLVPWDELLARLERLEGKLDSGGGGGGGVTSGGSAGGLSGGGSRAFGSASALGASEASDPRPSARTAPEPRPAPVSEPAPSERPRLSLPPMESAPVVRQASPAPRPSEPSGRGGGPPPTAPPPEEKAPEVPARRPPSQAQEGPPIEPLAWERAVRAFKEKRPMVGSLIERGALVRATYAQVTLAFSPGSLEADSARDPEKRRWLEEFLLVSFGRPVTVEIIERQGAEQETIHAKGELRAAEDRKRRERAVSEHPAVKDVLRVFSIDETSVSSKLKE